MNQSWFDRPSLYENKAFATEGDSILLIQDAVLALQSPIALASFVAKCRSNNIGLYALNGDCQVRGIVNQYAEIKLVDYTGFVELVAIHQKQLAW